MDRRRFFRLLGSGVAGIAVEQAIPFGRVWSFPSKIVIPEYPGKVLTKDPFSYAFVVGHEIWIRIPARFVFDIRDAWTRARTDKGIICQCVGFDWYDTAPVRS